MHPVATLSWYIIKINNSCGAIWSHWTNHVSFLIIKVCPDYPGDETPFGYFKCFNKQVSESLY